MTAQEIVVRLRAAGHQPHIDHDGDLSYFGEIDPEMADLIEFLYWPLLSALGGPLCWPDPSGFDGQRCTGPDPYAPPYSRLWCGALDPTRRLPHNIRAIMPTGEAHQQITVADRQRWPELFDPPPEKPKSKAAKRWERELGINEALFA